MNRTVSSLKCESFAALTKDIEQFTKIINNKISNGKNMNYSLHNINSTFRDFGCMDGFWSWATDTRLKEKFYFGFHLQPEWIENVIDEFNKEFKNFKIDIVWKKDLYITKSEDWSGPSYRFTDNSIDNVYLKAGSYIYTLNENVKVESKTKRKILYIFHHFLRSCSVPEYIINLWDLPPRDGYIEFVLNKNNESSKGRALTDYFVSKEDFLALDDESVLESFNRIVYNGVLKQSDILYIAGKIKKYGDEYFEDIPWEKGGNSLHPRTFYGLFLATNGAIYIKKKPVGAIINSNYYYINDDTFFYAQVHVNFGNSRVEFSNFGHRSEGGLRNYQLFPLIDIFNRYPEVDYEVVSEIIKAVNKIWKGKFKIPSKESFNME